MKVIDYTIRSAISKDSLIEKVNSRIQDGWQPIGGVAITEDRTYVQAMVKYAEADVPDMQTLVGELQKILGDKAPVFPPKADLLDLTGKTLPEDRRRIGFQKSSEK